MPTTSPYWDLFLWALTFNALVVLMFVFAYIFEIRPKVKRKDNPFARLSLERTRSNCARFVVIYLGLQLILTAVFVAVMEEFTRSGYASIVYFPSFFAAYTVFLFFRGDYHAKVRQAALETDTDILVDLNHRMLDRILNWKLEIVTLIGLATVGVVYFDYDTGSLLLSPLLLMIYVSIRTRKYYVRDAMSGWYKGFLYMTPLLQSMKLFTIWEEYLKSTYAFGSADYAVLGATAIAVAVHLALGLARFAGVGKALKEVLDGAVQNASEPATGGAC